MSKSIIFIFQFFKILGGGRRKPKNKKNIALVIYMYIINNKYSSYNALYPMQFYCATTERIVIYIYIKHKHENT